jgi:hypothetical protein
LWSQTPQTANADDTKRQDVRKLMALTGSQKLGEQVLNQMFLQLKSQLPKVPESFWKEVRSTIDFNEMLEQMIPVHEKYLTHEEVKELIKFYETPVGQKLVSVMPRISEESTVAGQKWVLGIGQMIEKRLEEGGYK